MTNQPASTRIICLGNPLHGNDGLGYQTLQHLQDYNWPHNVELIDGGTGGLTLLPWFTGCDRVVLVDAIAGSNHNATIEVFEDIDIERLGNAVSSDDQQHGGNLKTLLAMLPIYLAQCPRVDLIGIVCEDSDYYSHHLNPKVTHAIPLLCESVYELVGHPGKLDPAQ